MPNLDVLDQALTFIKDHPEKHNQRVWTCETGACLAGWGALLNGYRPVGHTNMDGTAWVVKIGSEAEARVDLSIENGHDGFNDLLLAGAEDVMSVAVKLFNISVADAQYLFASNNSADKLGLMIKDLHNGDSIASAWDWRRNSDGSYECDDHGDAVAERRGDVDA